MSELKRITLENFKCFDKLDISTSKITLLTGANSSGKSSIIYSILGPLQSEEFPVQFSPNGKYVRLGDYNAIVRDHNSSLDIKIGYEIDDKKITTVWKEEKESQLPQLQSLIIDGNYYSLSIKKVRKYHLDFTYNLGKDPNKDINSGELMKRLFKNIDQTFEIFRKENPESDKEDNQKRIEFKLDKFSDIRDRIHFTFDNLTELSDKIREEGNYTLQLIYDGVLRTFTRFDEKLNFISSFRLYPERTYYEISQKELKVGKFGEGYQDQIILWETEKAEEFLKLTKIMKDLSLFEEIKARRIGGGRYELKIKNKKGGTLSSLSDVGFGISQFLPIIVADLQLGEKSTLLIAQPEIHLHPKVQAQFGDYLITRVKEDKKNYVIETHSEYLMNRLRLAVVKGEIQEKDIAVFYLENDGKKAKKYELVFNKNGQIKGAPKGFFDTYMMDVMEIALEA